MPFFDFIAEGKRVDLSSPEAVALRKETTELVLAVMHDANAPPAEIRRCNARLLG